jgi:hypothetical protein
MTLARCELPEIVDPDRLLKTGPRFAIISPDQHGAPLDGGCSFKRRTLRSFGLKPAVAQPENVIEPIENHFIMGNADDRSILFDGYPAQQVHHDSGAS